MDTLEATSLPMGVNEIKIDNQTNSQPLCEHHSLIYLLCEGCPAIRVDIGAHCRSIFGWSILHWIANAHFPAGCRNSITVPTNAKKPAKSR